MTISLLVVAPPDLFWLIGFRLEVQTKSYYAKQVGILLMVKFPRKF